MFQKKVFFYLFSQFWVVNLVNCAQNVKKIGFLIFSFNCNVQLSLLKFLLVILVSFSNNRDNICVFLKLRDGNKILLATAILEDVQYQMNSTILDFIFFSCLLLSIYLFFLDCHLFKLINNHSFLQLIDNIGSALLNALKISNSWCINHIQFKLMFIVVLWLYRVLYEIFCFWSNFIYVDLLKLFFLIYIHSMLFILVFFFIVLLFLCLLNQLFGNLEIKFSKKQVNKGRFATPGGSTYHYIKINFGPFSFWFSSWISQFMHVFNRHWFF